MLSYRCLQMEWWANNPGCDNLGWPDPQPHLIYVASYTDPLLFLFERTQQLTPSTTRGKPWRHRVWAGPKIVRPHRWGPWIMKRFLGYWSPQERRNPPSPTTERIKATLISFKKKKAQRKGTLPLEFRDWLKDFRIWELLKLTMRLLTPQRSRTTEVPLAGILTSLYSSGSVSHAQDNPHAHGNCNYDRVVRERGR